MESMINKNIYDLYDYYGIDYYSWDSEHEDSEWSQKDVDRFEAVAYIVEGKPLPRDLEERLLKYKAEEEALKENKGGN